MKIYKSVVKKYFSQKISLEEFLLKLTPLNSDQISDVAKKGGVWIQKKGIGKIITDFIDTKAKELSCTCVVLDAFTGNFPAHRFYYNQGYEPRGFHFIKTINENGFS